MNPAALLHPLAAMILSPLLLGVINRTKAFFAGRNGQPLLQAYYDLFKLIHKNAVYSHTTSWIFRFGPLAGLTSAITALLILPLGSIAGVFQFAGDLIFLTYLLGVMRFVTVIAALDTGSPFEGMGASREVQFSVLAEPALLLSLLALSETGKLSLTGGIPDSFSHFSLSGMYANLSFSVWMHSGMVLLLAARAILIILLTENSLIPVDDPTTHLELTMIHEVMVLDHSGPDFALILYGSALKLWIFSSLLAGFLVPVRSGIFWIDASATIGGIFLLAVGIGMIESTMARLRLLRVPQLLSGAGVLSILALVLVLKR